MLLLPYCYFFLFLGAKIRLFFETYKFLMKKRQYTKILKWLMEPGAPWSARGR